MILPNQLIFYYLDSENCCSTVRLSGAQRSELNQLYTITNRIVSGRPSYIDQNNEYGIWWKGFDDWMIGRYSDIDNDRILFGYFQNDQDTACPSHSEHWQETNNNAEWEANVNAHLSCDGTYQY